MNKGHALELALLLQATPKMLLTCTLVCRRWNKRFKDDTYWYRFKSYILNCIPTLAAFFTPDKPIWKVLVKVLWPPVVHGKAAFYAQWENMGPLVCAAMIECAHGKPERIQRIDPTIVHYTDGNKCHVTLGMYPKDTEQLIIGRNIGGNSNVFTGRTYVPSCCVHRHLPLWFMDYESGYIAQQTNVIVLPSVQTHDIISLYGRYKDIVTCVPGGPRFRDQTGNICGRHVKTNKLFFEQEDE